MLRFRVCTVVLHCGHIRIKMQGYICKRKKILIAENELIGDFLPFYYQVLYILYDFKAKVNIQRVEKRQQRQQQG